jgi:hypothetical protein
MLVLAARGISNRQIALELGPNTHVVRRVRKDLPGTYLECFKPRIQVYHRSSLTQSGQKTAGTCSRLSSESCNTTFTLTTNVAVGCSFQHALPESTRVLGGISADRRTGDP